MKPAKHILDPAFHYRPSYDTDIRKTFKRAVRESSQVPARPQAAPIVVPLKKRGYGP